MAGRMAKRRSSPCISVSRARARGYRAPVATRTRRPPAPGGAPAPAAEHRLIALLALTLGVFLVTVNVGVVVVALPAIQADLHAPADQAAWVIDAFNLVGASLLLSAGYLADRFGRRRMLCAGYAIFATGALLCAIAPTAGWLIASRVVQALGGTALT